MSERTTAGGAPPRSMNNLTGLDYRAEAARFGTSTPTGPGTPALPPGGIIDFHTHVNGRLAGGIYAQAARAYGITRVFTQVRLGDAETIRATMGDEAPRGGPALDFIAFPDFRHSDRWWSFTEGYLADIGAFRERFGARFIKLWNAPRLKEIFTNPDARDVTEFDGAWRVRHVELAQSLGMGVMVHIADPDTWYATKYSDATKYGTKRDTYRGLRAMLDRFRGPWVAAHMGGCPEDLGFLDELLSTHANLHLDTSATRWVVREMSRHDPGRVREFFSRWRKRLVFGSDIVTVDDHVQPQKNNPDHPKSDQASSPAEAFDLYASRYWALRTMLETTFDGPSPIADPDLKMVEPQTYDDMSAPRLRGVALGRDVLADIYRGNAERVMGEVGMEPVGSSQ